MVLPWVNNLLGLKSNRSRKAPRLTNRPRKKNLQLLAEQLEARTLLTITATAITAAMPGGSPGTMLLLPNGTVMVQSDSDSSGVSNLWELLKPNSTGSYVNGSWSSFPSMSLQRLYFGSVVFPSDQVMVMGGEYSGSAGSDNESNAGEIYSMATNSWSSMASYSESSFGDDELQILSVGPHAGDILGGYLEGPQTFSYNVGSNTWAQRGTKLDNDASDEEDFVQLSGGDIVSYNINASPGVNSVNTSNPASGQYYNPTTDSWTATGPVPVGLSSATVPDDSNFDELGPGLLLPPTSTNPEGLVFLVGATGPFTGSTFTGGAHSALYNPVNNTWTAGPNIPVTGYGADDAPGAVLPDGNVLFLADNPAYNSPSKMFEYNPTANTITDVTSTLPSGLRTDLGDYSCYVDRMVSLPSGQVLFSDSSQVWALSETGTVNSAWQPTISGITNTSPGVYSLSGTQLTGMNEGSTYGDDAQMSTNYPIVRLTSSSGTVYYATTSNWSNAGSVQTGSTTETTTFKLPTSLTTSGMYTLNVITNGIASDSTNLQIQVAVTVSGVSPSSGPTAGGTTVAISGSGFTGATAVQFGGVNATSFTVSSATQITAIYPADTAGTVDVTVTVPVSGTSATTAADQFTYVAAPSVTSVSPNGGTAAGGTSVVINGTAFTGATLVKFGAINATSFTVNSATQITATDPAAAAAGVVDVTVTTAGGTSPTSAADHFTYNPQVTGVNPGSGPLAGGTTIVITGFGFTGATAVQFGGTDATSFTLNSATQITATDPAGTAGTVDVRVTVPGGDTSATSAADLFTYVAAPSVTGLSPSGGGSAGGTSVIVTGTGFTGATAVVFGANNATTFTVSSATQITATDSAGSGTVDIRVTTPGGTSATSAADQFVYNPAPQVTGVNPASGPTVGGSSVVITGGGFTGATAVHFGTSAATTFTVNSATQITATDPAGAVGTVNVTVATSIGTSATSSADQFTYTVNPVVTLSSTNLADSSATLTINGAGFSTTPASNTVTFNLGVAGIVTSSTFTQLIVTLSGPPTALGSLTAVVVTNGLSSGAAVQVATEVNGDWLVASTAGSGGTLSVLTLPYAVSNYLSGDQIAFASALSGSTITLSSGLTLNHNVTLTGLGAPNLAVSGNNTHEVFNIPTGVTASISALTIEDGLAASGSGIKNSGILTLTSDAISNNGVVNNTTNRYGAGIYNSGTLTVTGSTINGNTTYTDGGGIYNTGTATLSNSTVFGNAGYTDGGGIVNSGTLTLTDATVYGNFGWDNETNLPEDGGGIYNSGTLNMDNTIVAGNTTSGTGPDIDGTIAVAHYCLIANNSGHTISSGSNNQLGVSAGLATALAYNNGAPTETLAVLAGSATIGTGDPGQAGTTSQNLVIRAAIPEIGAFQILAPVVTNVNLNTGPTAGGTSVVITGTGFTGATAVHFGTNLATGVTVNAAGTQINATDPPGNGTVDVTVTIPVGGTSATSAADLFTYVAVPTVTSVSPASGPTAGGTSVTIMGTDFTDATAVSFGSTAATTFTVNSATQITATDPAGSGTVDVTVTIPVGGTSAASMADQFTYTTPTTFLVSSITLLSGDNGFLTTFSAAYNIAQLNLYTGDSGGTLGPRVVQITGPGNTTIFGGTNLDPMRFNAVPINSTQLELILTGLNHVVAAPVLPAGNYTVTLDGGSNNPGFRRASDNGYLDGNDDGTIQPVDNYISPNLTVTAIPASTDVVSIGDLVAGPGQTLPVPLVLSGGSGSVSQTTAVNLGIASPVNGAYTVTGFTVNSALSGISVNFTPATGALTLSSATPFSTSDSPLLLGNFTFAVSGLGNAGTAAGIDTKTPIAISITSVLDGSSPKPFVGENGFHVSAYLGNLVAPIGVYNETDVSQLQGLIITSVRALALYPNVDPLLLADVNEDGIINENDVSQMQARILGLPSSIPALPSGASGVAVNGADPVLFVGSSFTPDGQPANLGSLIPGSTVLVPLSVFVTDRNGVNVTAAEAAFSFDPKVFTLNSVTAGAIANGSLGGSPFAVAFAEGAPGEVNAIGSASLGPNLAYGQTATLFLVILTVRSDAPVGGTVFNLMSSEAGLQTGLQDNLGRNLVLSPAPENRAGDNLDGAFTVNSGKPVQLPVGISVGTTATGGQKQAVSVATPTLMAWEQLTTLLFEATANQFVPNASNGYRAVAAAVPLTPATEGKKQAGPITAPQPVAWQQLATRLFENAAQRADPNYYPTVQW